MASPLEDRWEERLQTWAEYLDQKEKGGKVKISSAYSLVGRGGRAEDDGIPIHVGDALDTNSLVIQLPEYLRTAIRVWYCQTGTVGQKAARMGIHRDTLADRVVGAKHKLEDLHLRRRSSKAKSHNRSPQQA